MKANNLPKFPLVDLLFPVEKVLISEKFPAISSISSTEYGIFATVDGNEMLLNTCSKTYELVQNSMIFLVIEKILNDANIGFDVTYGMYDFSRFYADYTIKTGGISVGSKKDLIFPVLRVEHSYNGLWKYKMTFGYFRMICSNGLVVPVEGKEEQNFSIVGKHTKSILQSLDTLLEKIKFFTKNNKQYSERFQVVSERWFPKWQDRVEAVIEATGVGKRGFDQITARIKQEAKELTGGKVNDWLIYNGINYHIFNATTADGKPYETASNLRIDADKKVWNAIWDNPTTAGLKKKTKKTLVEA